MRIEDGKEIGQLSRIDASDDIYISPDFVYILWGAYELDTIFVIKNPFKEQMLLQ